MLTAARRKNARIRICKQVSKPFFYRVQSENSMGSLPRVVNLEVFGNGTWKIRGHLQKTLLFTLKKVWPNIMNIFSLNKKGVGFGISIIEGGIVNLFEATKMNEIMSERSKIEKIYFVGRVFINGQKCHFHLTLIFLTM